MRTSSDVPRGTSPTRRHREKMGAVLPACSVGQCALQFGMDERRQPGERCLIAVSPRQQ